MRLTQRETGMPADRLTPVATPKVLLCTARADIGGGPKHVFLVLEALLGDLAVACPEEAPYADAYREVIGSNRVHLIPSRSAGPRAQLAAARVLRRVRPDVVHTHGKGAGILFRPWCRALGIPTVHTFHGLHTGEYGAAMKSTYHLIERLLGMGDAAAVAVSSDEAELLAGAGITSRAAVIPNGVVVGTPLERRRQRHLRLAFAGRLVYQKDPRRLVELVASLQSDVTLTVFGDGPLRSDAAVAAAAADVELVGEVDQPSPRYGDFDVYVSAARWEGMPLAVLEALAAGLPCVLSDVAGHRQIAELAPEAVKLYDRDNARSFQRALAPLTDREVLELASKAAIEAAAEHFAIDRVAAELGRLYAVAGSRGRTP